MKNNKKKAPVKLHEDLLYFQHFMLIFLSLPLISDYHHLKDFKCTYGLLDVVRHLSVLFGCFQMTVILED